MRLVVMNFLGATATAYNLADTEQEWPLGTRAFAYQGDPSTTANELNASGQFIYGQVTGAIACGTPCTLNSLSYTASALANTANLGVPVTIAANRFTATGQYGWFQVSGQAPVVNNGTFAADAAVFIQAAGVLSTTVAAGKQILSCRSLIAAAATFTKTIRTRTGSQVISVPDTKGLFCGLTVSGTGIPGSTTITDIDPGGNLVTISNAATASGSVTGTFTFTNLGAVTIESPFAQGQIT